MYKNVEDGDVAIGSMSS